MASERVTNEPRVPDAELLDWANRRPAFLPTSVPHQRVLDVVSDLLDCRAELSQLRDVAADLAKERAAREEQEKRWRTIRERNSRCIAAANEDAERLAKVLEAMTGPNYPANEWRHSLESAAAALAAHRERVR